MNGRNRFWKIKIVLTALVNQIDIAVDVFFDVELELIACLQGSIPGDGHMRIGVCTGFCNKGPLEIDRPFRVIGWSRVSDR